MVTRILSSIHLIIGNKRRNLVIPHFRVKNICEIEFENAKKIGFKGIIFDKDNTLTDFYKDELNPKIKVYKHKKILISEMFIRMSKNIWN